MVRHPLRLTMAVLLSLLILMTALLGIFGFALPIQFSETFLGELPVKMQLLRSAPSPRLIVVGGSSVPFSLKSDLIQAAFPQYTVVDFGLYADIGTPVMLDLLEEELAAGDMVIIMPEQNAQALSSYFSADSLWQAMDGDFSLLKNLDHRRYEKLSAAFAGFAGKKCYYCFTGGPDLEGIYVQDSFNEYGDISSPLRNCNIMPGQYDPNQRIRFEPDEMDEDFIELLNEFAALCREKQVQVYYRFGAMNRAALETGAEETADDYYDHLNSLLDFSVLGDPHRSIMESGWFYDTNFHLNDSGATVFTKYFIEDLKVLFRDTSVTDIPLPAMPKPESGVVLQGDNSCADCFTYRQAETGWIITGLTEKGQKATRLIVPVWHDGAAVTGIDAGVFRNNRMLVALTLQPNIGLLPDGMFYGCGRLDRLILTGVPADYTVGDGLMEGADFVICVGKDRIDQFRRHYTWQAYNEYIVE